MANPYHHEGYQEHEGSTRALEEDPRQIRGGRCTPIPDIRPRALRAWFNSEKERGAAIDTDDHKPAEDDDHALFFRRLSPDHKTT
jgi:hypothetical protein